MAKKQAAVDVAAQQRAQEQAEVQQAFLKGISTLRDLIAPSSIEIHSSYFRLGTKYGRTLYVYGYPRRIYTGWLSGLINVDEVLDVSMYIYPVESQVVLNNLRKKVTQLEASASINNEKGKTRDPAIEAAINDAEELRDQLQLGAERFFRYGLYVTLYADSLDELNFVQNKIETMFGQQMVFSKVASSQQEQGLNSTVPQMSDQLQIRRNMNTGAISTSFPFTSADLTDNTGILYGINMHNNGLVIFDRFKLENANMVVFAKSGAGKSFTVKLEALRSMMMGSEILIIDPENEYQKLAEAVGGSYIRLSLTSNTRINPFDLPRVIDNDEAEDALRANLVTLHGLFRLMLGGTQVAANGMPLAALSPSEEADLDQALIDTYARAGITSDPLTHNSPPPTINDLYDTLLHMGGSGPQLAQRLRRYTTGTFAGIFSQQSNIDINNPMVVFNIRDLEDELRPVAMYIVLSHIWNITRTVQKKRMLIVDEAWQLMKYDDSANFLFSLAKRARKYYLGLTTITQDVEDFMGSKMGRAIVANSSMQLLLKQSSSAVDVLSDVFKLTEEEKKRLANFPIGQGLFFAGQSHVHIQIQASPTEQQLITTNPQATRQNPTPNSSPLS
ncbi:conjugal transfer protein TraC [Candidatus Saccharibacteria bacterium]|nr:conjugal transfer protein TraC [Candidatus Saccharibacteria bacterium]MBJ58763.1 conjugal transfer protein TraC [Candidatus Saccharibacteria bacterium]MBQ68620.1 conjugal transfer protein TraC [Candidatus Saccharibacteria bacterium]|tara:strand:+ start:8321 stop:10168 length:1848 start_codon:yes stop_codon:yes gene_type:complete